MNKVYKYDIHWQIARSKVKSIKSIGEKLSFILDFFVERNILSNKERILNWLKGLRVSCKDKDNKLFEEFLVTINNYSVTEGDFTNRTFDRDDFIYYSNESILYLFKDLLVRAKKWLSKGYINEEFNEFILGIISYLDSTLIVSKDYNKMRKAYLDLLEIAKTLPNTYKWVF